MKLTQADIGVKKRASSKLAQKWSGKNVRLIIFEQFKEDTP